MTEPLRNLGKSLVALTHDTFPNALPPYKRVYWANTPNKPLSIPVWELRDIATNYGATVDLGLRITILRLLNRIREAEESAGKS